MTNTTHTPAGARVSAAAGQAADAASDALDSGRQFATGAAHLIGEAARDVRGSAADLARRGAASVSDATLVAQRQFGEYARATKGYVARDPWTAALVAAAIGAAAGVLAMSVLRRPRDGN